MQPYFHIGKYCERFIFGFPGDRDFYYKTKTYPYYDAHDDRNMRSGLH